MSTSVYMWTRMPRLSTKSGAVGLNLQMPKGAPKRMEAFNDLKIKQIKVG